MFRSRHFLILLYLKLVYFNKEGVNKYRSISIWDFRNIYIYNLNIFRMNEYKNI